MLPEASTRTYLNTYQKETRKKQKKRKEQQRKREKKERRRRDGYCLGERENLVLLMVKVMLGITGINLQSTIASPSIKVTAPILLLKD